MQCLNCGARLPDGSRFCGSCGAPLSARRPQAAAYPERKRPPVFLFMVLAVLVAVGCAAGYFMHQNALENDPLHGAELKRQTVWETDGLSVTVTGLRYDAGDYEYPYCIDLSVSGGSLSDCAAAVNGLAVDTRTTASGIAFSRRSVYQRIGFDRFAEIDLVLRNSATGRCSDVIRLQTGLKKPEAHLDTRGQELYSADGVTVRYKSIYPMYRETGPGLEFYVENHTADTLVLRAADIAVDGVLVSGRMETAFPPGTVGYAVLELDTAELEQKGVLPMRAVTAELSFSEFAAQQTVTVFSAEIPSL